MTLKVFIIEIFPVVLIFLGFATVHSHHTYVKRCQMGPPSKHLRARFPWGLRSEVH
jgi:hypothetical protein